jgi:Peptidase family M28
MDEELLIMSQASVAGMGTKSSTSTSTVPVSLLAWLAVAALAVFAVVEMKAPEPVGARAPDGEFSAERALNYVGGFAQSPHPFGSSANDRVREYLVAQLTLLGLSPEVREGVGIRNSPRRFVIGGTHNVVGRLKGTGSSGAVVLMAHYDSVYRGAGAADDGAGVAAILESVRALRARPPLKNDLIVLFTDGEEVGLLGADAFASSDPFMKDVGIILNFEARGDQGASLLFETSAKNGTLIRAVAESSPYPVGSSLFYSLYKLLPNDTDVSVFRPYHVPALNFAFGQGFDAYHTSLDTVQNLSAASLQHHGSYALSLAQYFGGIDLSLLKTAAQDDVFFDWIGWHLVSYGQRWVVPGESLATMVLIAAILLYVRRSDLKMSRILLALLPSLAILILIPLVLVAADWIVTNLLAGRMIIGDSPANACLLASLVLFGACIGSFLFATFRRSFSIQELSLAGMIVVCCLSWGLALVLPGGSYLLFWPLLLLALGYLIAALMETGTRSRAEKLVGAVGAAASVLLFAPIVYLLYIFLNLQLITSAAAGLLLGLLFIACVPFFDIGIPHNRSRTVALVLFVGALVVGAAGAKLSLYSPQHPRRDSALYSLNADDHSALWVSYDQSLDSWTKQFFPGNPPVRQARPDRLHGWQRPVLSAPATPLDLNPPIAEIKSVEQSGDLRKIRMNVRSQRAASALFLTFSKGVQPVSIHFQGREVAVQADPSFFTVVLLGMGSGGADFDITLKGPAGSSFWLTDQSYGLPTQTAQRPANYIAADGSDVTVVSRKYPL